MRKPLREWFVAANAGQSPAGRAGCRGGSGPGAALRHAAVTAGGGVCLDSLVDRREHLA